MMAATREDPVVVSDSSEVLSDTENGEWLELELQSLLQSLITWPLNVHTLQNVCRPLIRFVFFSLFAARNEKA